MSSFDSLVEQMKLKNEAREKLSLRIRKEIRKEPRMS